jgi:hypothetical protein
MARASPRPNRVVCLMAEVYSQINIMRCILHISASLTASGREGER